MAALLQFLLTIDLVWQVTLQRPTVVAEIGFLLAVTKFFVPTMAISGVSPIPFISQDIYLEGRLEAGPFPYHLAMFWCATSLFEP